ncbi:PH domain-containing protein [Pseudactinotalea sp. HY158]|uniref:PH domain-containing protein n=1 Tax=Pseudactinotalea sp. HY158 TaxID=2654547 RepID=UPI00129D03BD|nr:PH domain-containing protein [Pseudactinotalea sp. HY158]QGH68764.1 hypothetical protein GCE65_04075 [Pseudactinotalea sp. HY158]
MPESPGAFDTAVFRTGFSRVFPWVAAAAALAGAIAAATRGGWGDLWRSGPWIALAVALVWLLFALPRVEVSGGGVLLVNVARTVWVPWPAFSSADARWALRVRTDDDREFSSWALPAGSGSLRRLPLRDGGRAESGHARPGERAPSMIRGGSAEAAVLEIGERVRSLTEAGFLPARPEAPARVSLNRRPLAVLAVIAAVAAGSAVLG